MKALVLTAPSRFSVEDVPKPHCAAGEVLVAVKACGICGSDVHGMDGSTGRRKIFIQGFDSAARTECTISVIAPF